MPPDNSTAVSCSLRSNRAARSARTTGSWHRRSSRSGRASLRALPASCAHWCPTASAPQDGCAAVARRAPSSASLFSRSTACHESSTAVPSPCSHQSRVSCANNPPPRSAQSLRRPLPIRSSRLPSRSPLGSAGSTAFRATRGSRLYRHAFSTRATAALHDGCSPPTLRQPRAA